MRLCKRGLSVWFVDQFVCVSPPFGVCLMQICYSIAPFVTSAFQTLIVLISVVLHIGDMKY